MQHTNNWPCLGYTFEAKPWLGQHRLTLCTTTPLFETSPLHHATGSTEGYYGVSTGLYPNLLQWGETRGAKVPSVSQPVWDFLVQAAELPLAQDCFTNPDKGVIIGQSSLPGFASRIIMRIEDLDAAQPIVDCAAETLFAAEHQDGFKTVWLPTTAEPISPLEWRLYDRLRAS